MDVLQRLAELRQQRPTLRLYALVDGAQHHAYRGEWLEPGPDRIALFKGTPDEALAHAGPWLIDCEDSPHIDDLAAFERQAPAVSWLITHQDLRGLAQLLQLHLDARLPDGRIALLRFWDVRVLIRLATVLTPKQRESMFGLIHEWHALHNGARGWIGREESDHAR